MPTFGSFALLLALALSGYTLLLGVIDDSSCRLDYELHTREKGAGVVPG